MMLCVHNVHVFLRMSSFACLPSPVYLHLSSFACLPSPVFLRLSIFACLPLSVHFSQSTLACLPSPVCLHACLPPCLSNFAVYLSLSASQAVFLVGQTKKFHSVYRTFFLLSTNLPHVQNAPPILYPSLVCLSFSLSFDMLFFAFPPLLFLSACPFFLLNILPLSISLFVTLSLHICFLLVARLLARRPAGARWDYRIRIGARHPGGPFAL